MQVVDNVWKETISLAYTTLSCLQEWRTRGCAYTKDRQIVGRAYDPVPSLLWGLAAQWLSFLSLTASGLPFSPVFKPRDPPKMQTWPLHSLPTCLWFPSAHKTHRVGLGCCQGALWPASPAPLTSAFTELCFRLCGSVSGPVDCSLGKTAVLLWELNWTINMKCLHSSQNVITAQ